MVHWQSDKILIVLVGISSLHFNLIRSDCSASGADSSGICAIDEIDRRHIAENRIESKDRRDLWRSNLNRERRGECCSHFYFTIYFKFYLLVDFSGERSEGYELNRRREQSSRLDAIIRQQRRFDEQRIDYSRRVEGRVSRNDRSIRAGLDDVARNHIRNQDERRREKSTRRVNANFDHSERIRSSRGNAMAVNVRRELMNERYENNVRDINRRDDRVSRRERFGEENRNRDNNRRSEDRDETRMQLNSRRVRQHEQNQLSEARGSERSSLETRFDQKGERRNSLKRDMVQKLPIDTESVISRRIHRRIERQTLDRRVHQRSDIRMGRINEKRIDRRIQSKNRRNAHQMEHNDRSGRESRTLRRSVERRVPASADAHRFEENRSAEPRHVASTPLQRQTNVSATLAWQMAQALLIGVLIMKIVRKNDTLKPKR